MRDVDEGEEPSDEGEGEDLFEGDHFMKCVVHSS